jgi:hypothetical protein
VVWSQRGSPGALADRQVRKDLPYEESRKDLPYEWIWKDRPDDEA